MTAVQKNFAISDDTIYCLAITSTGKNKCDVTLRIAKIEASTQVFSKSTETSASVDTSTKIKTSDVINKLVAICNQQPEGSYNEKVDLKKSNIRDTSPEKIVHQHLSATSDTPSQSADIRNIIAENSASQTFSSCSEAPPKPPRLSSLSNAVASKVKKPHPAPRTIFFESTSSSHQQVLSPLSRQRPKKSSDLHPERNYSAQPGSVEDNSGTAVIPSDNQQCQPNRGKKARKNFDGFYGKNTLKKNMNTSTFINDVITAINNQFPHYHDSLLINNFISCTLKAIIDQDGTFGYLDNLTNARQELINTAINSRLSPFNKKDTDHENIFTSLETTIKNKEKITEAVLSEIITLQETIFKVAQEKIPPFLKKMSYPLIEGESRHPFASEKIAEYLKHTFPGKLGIEENIINGVFSQLKEYNDVFFRDSFYQLEEKQLNVQKQLETLHSSNQSKISRSDLESLLKSPMLPDSLKTSIDEFFAVKKRYNDISQRNLHILKDYPDCYQKTDFLKKQGILSESFNSSADVYIQNTQFPIKKESNVLPASQPAEAKIGSSSSSRKSIALASEKVKSQHLFRAIALKLASRTAVVTGLIMTMTSGFFIATGSLTSATTAAVLGPSIAAFVATSPLLLPLIIAISGVALIAGGAAFLFNSTRRDHSQPDVAEATSQIDSRQQAGISATASA